MPRATAEAAVQAISAQPNETGGTCFSLYFHRQFFRKILWRILESEAYHGLTSGPAKISIPGNKINNPSPTLAVQWNCPFCDHCFLTSTELLKHDKDTHENENHNKSYHYKCPTCEFHSAFPQNIKTHLRIIHHLFFYDPPEQQPKPPVASISMSSTPTTLYRCPNCVCVSNF